jgi:tRNA(Arg) A34 adenosine deaminase TadA
MKSSVRDMFEIAARISEPRTDDDYIKNYWFGCVGIRGADDVMVVSKNLSVNLYIPENRHDPLKIYQKIASTHAESRVLKKMSTGGNLYVARISKGPFLKNGEYKYLMARPCNMCEQAIKSKKVERVYYTVSNKQFGIFYPKQNRDVVCDY